MAPSADDKKYATDTRKWSNGLYGVRAGAISATGAATNTKWFADAGYIVCVGPMPQTKPEEDNATVCGVLPDVFAAADFGQAHR